MQPFSNLVCLCFVHLNQKKFPQF